MTARTLITVVLVLLAASAALVLFVLGTLVLLAYVRGADARAFAGAQPVQVLVVDRPVPAGTSGDGLADFVRTDTVPAKAAVHAGLLRPEESGIIKVTIVERLPNYRGTTRHGVSSSPFGSGPV